MKPSAKNLHLESQKERFSIFVAEASNWATVSFDLPAL
jgi:hypothetical protein